MVGELQVVIPQGLVEIRLTVLAKFCTQPFYLLLAN